MTTIDQPHSPFTMPALGWAHGALAPHISAETIDYHYGKHLQTYVNNLNNLVPGSRFAGVNLEGIIRGATGPVFNNAAQVWNHSMYFAQLSPRARTRPEGRLAAAIERDFGSFDALGEQFGKAALALFGSGWVWLAAASADRRDKGAKSPKLEIISSPNAGNPLTDNKVPLMVIDLWEHAYYIDHRNARAASIDAFWKILDWNLAEQRY